MPKYEDGIYTVDGHEFTDFIAAKEYIDEAYGLDGVDEFADDFS